MFTPVLRDLATLEAKATGSGAGGQLETVMSVTEIDQLVEEEEAMKDPGTAGEASAPEPPHSPPQLATQPSTSSVGLQGLKSTLLERVSSRNSVAPAPASTETLEDPNPSLSRQNTSNVEGKIDELMDMLECPVCLDTADSAPIYQCPEGHLICAECNAKMVDCPQCGHSLLNARNRTAEALAERLSDLRGTRVRGIAPTQTIKVAVEEPQMVGKGLFAHVAFRVITKVGGGGNNSEASSDQSGGSGYGSMSEFTVYRRYRDFAQLHTKLFENYRGTSIIVPPPPEESKVKSIWANVADHELEPKMAAEKGPGYSNLGMTNNLRCRQLDRYVNRLAKHPTIRKDPDFRTFLQETKVQNSLKVKKSLGLSLSDTFHGLSMTTTKLTTTETDIWFKTRELLQKELRDQLNYLKKDIRKMGQEKMSLYLATTSFRTNLIQSLAVGTQRRSAKTNIEKEGNDLLKKVADLQAGMADVYLHQADADEQLAFLAMDYINMLDAVNITLDNRRKALRSLNKKVKGSGRVAPEKMSKIDEYQSEFDKLSQTLRRELEHFDNVMREEFSENLGIYHKQYTTAIKSHREKGLPEVSPDHSMSQEQPAPSSE